MRPNTLSTQYESLIVQYFFELVKALQSRVCLTLDDPSREGLDVGFFALLCKIIKLQWSAKTVTTGES